MDRTWREIAAPIVAAVVARTEPGSPERRKALFDAYPFGERAMWPYKVWLEEIAYQTGRKLRPRPRMGARPILDTPGQLRIAL